MNRLQLRRIDFYPAAGRALHGIGLVGVKQRIEDFNKLAGAGIACFWRWQCALTKILFTDRRGHCVAARAPTAEMVERADLTRQVIEVQPAGADGGNQADMRVRLAQRRQRFEFSAMWLRYDALFCCAVKSALMR